MGAPKLTRSHRVRQIRALQAEGKSMKEIARLIGLAYSTVVTYNSDPDGSRARRYMEGMKRRCVSCGNPCGKESTLCRACYFAEVRRNKQWSAEAIVASLQAFAEKWGRPPVWTDTMAYPEELPNGKLIWREFGSWANAVEAAGFPRPQRGGSKPRKVRA